MNESANSAVSKGAVYLFALATIAAGVFDLKWGEFEAAHQPIGALGENIPGQKLFAYITAVWMILAGVAILWRRTRRGGALAAALIYLVFGLFWLPRFYTAPHVLGFRLTLIVGLLAGVFTQLMVVAGALVLFTSVAGSLHKSRAVARWVIGLAAVLFGVVHLTGVQDVAGMVPKWMPLGGSFWVILSGVAFLLAGLAILVGILNRLAAHLLALMIVLFEIILIPMAFANPGNHIAWGSNAYSLAAAGAVWIFASSISKAQQQHDTAAYPSSFHSPQASS
ncbi:MAG TPA: DoxX family membrane protein [Pyrinomonadaceae bacterium]|jgi:uncharacterized membrane protein